MMKYGLCQNRNCTIFLVIDESTIDRETNGWTDRRTEGHMNPLTEVGRGLFVEKHLVYSISCMRDQPTNVMTDGPMNRQID